MQTEHIFYENETGSSFMARNQHLAIAPCKNKPGKFFFVGAVDGVGAVSDAAMTVLKAEMAKPNMTLAKAMTLLAVGKMKTEDGVEILCIHKVGAPTNALFSC